MPGPVSSAFHLPSQLRFFIVCTASVLCALSLIFTNLFFIGQADPGFFSVAGAVLLGTGFEGLKLAMPELAQRARQSVSPSDRSLGFFYSAAMILLMTASVVASMAYLAQKNADGARSRWLASSDYRTLVAAERDTASQVGSYRAAAKRYRSFDRISLGMTADAKAAQLLPALADIRAQLRTSEQKFAANRDVFQVVAGLLARDVTVTQSLPETVTLFRVTWDFFISVMLELGCIGLMVALARHRAVERQRDSVTCHRDSVTHRDCDVTVTPPESQSHPALALPRSRYEEVRAAIVSGDIQPVHRRVRPAFNLGQTTTRQIFAKLVREGVLTKTARGYSCLVDGREPNTHRGMGFQLGFEGVAS